ncbi:MAG: hypothetical protein L0I76_04010 [Pseudonocardia sp.]|nr:hypothetical protein [Pseudonocardia sp.]
MSDTADRDSTITNSTTTTTTAATTSSEAVARSPIAPRDPVVRSGWEVSARRSTAECTLADETPASKALVRAPFRGAVRDLLGTPFGRALRREMAGVPVLAVGSGPGEWLVIGPSDAGSRVREHLGSATAGSGEFATVVDLTHGRALMRLRGRRSADLLNKLCGMDLREASAPDGAAFRTSVAGVATDVIRDDASELSYLLHCERSSGQYLFDALRDAGAEFGIDTTGPDHPAAGSPAGSARAAVR